MDIGGNFGAYTLYSGTNSFVQNIFSTGNTLTGNSNVGGK